MTYRSKDSYRSGFKVYLEELKPLTDLNYQSRVWQNGVGPEWDSYEESTMFFKEETENILPEYKEFGLSEKQRDDLQKLYDMVDEYDDIYPLYSHPMVDNSDTTDQHPTLIDNIAIMKDPKWHEIVKFAKTIYDDLKKLSLKQDDHKARESMYKGFFNQWLSR